jgi:hypothetical protein
MSWFGGDADRARSELEERELSAVYIMPAVSYDAPVRLTISFRLMPFGSLPSSRYLLDF